jgi:hypothetical protein
MRVYYRGPDALITSELFVRRVTTTASYAICDLRGVGIAPAPETGRARPFVAAAVGLAGLAASTAALLAGALIIVPPLFVCTLAAFTAAIFWPRRPGRWELRATYQGRPISLYTSTDATTFHQVTRALRRAIEEDQRPPRLQDAA